MNILWLFDSCGYIIFSGMMLAGITALAYCAWASRKSSTPESRRRAMLFSIAPFAVGIIGVLYGLVVLMMANQPIPNAVGNLAKVCLAGLVVTVIPLTWALLLRSQRRMA